MKKTFALLLALVMCLGVLAGCQQEPVATTTAPTTTAATSGNNETTAPTEEPEYSFEGKSLDIWTVHDLNGHDLDKWVKEDLGLDLVFTVTPEGTFDAVMTEKVTPSLAFLSGPSKGHTMGRYGAFINFYDYKDIMPNFFAKYESYGDDVKGMYETGESELYTAPIFLNGDVQHYGWFYREDIFKELNLSAPTNWDEFLDVCKALKEAYPDSYPFTARNLTVALSFFSEFAQQFGAKFSWQYPALDYNTGTYFNGYTTDGARDMLQKMRNLIDLGYMDIATLANDTSMWVADMTTGKSFITYDKAFQLTSLENAGQEANPDFSLAWWHNMPCNEYATAEGWNYNCHKSYDYNYGWVITTKCPDIELAVRYLDWLYSEEGSQLFSWGKEGLSYEVDADGNKNFIEGYDKTFFARYQTGANIDMKATASTYSTKCQDMIFDTMEVSLAGNYKQPTLVFTDEEKKVIETYSMTWFETYQAYWQKFLLGEVDINDDATWEKFKAEMASYNEAELIEIHNAAYQRYLGN